MGIFFFKSTYSWTCVVQAHAAQGSTVLKKKSEQSSLRNRVVSQLQRGFEKHFERLDKHAKTLREFS